ncbi:hypothetical protein C8R48DRAFT_692691 [Suillus tomentosus]|nr:hypothetical protein C8R48DRAFT_692691 [Suillus tomentosus]
MTLRWLSIFFVCMIRVLSRRHRTVFCKCPPSSHPDNPPRSSYRQGPFFVGVKVPRHFKFWSPLRFAVFVDFLIMIEGPLAFSILSVTSRS